MCFPRPALVLRVLWSSQTQRGDARNGMLLKDPKALQNVIWLSRATNATLRKRSGHKVSLITYKSEDNFCDFSIRF